MGKGFETPEERRKFEQEKINKRNKAAQDSENAAIQRAEMQGDSDFMDDVLGLVHEVEYMSNDVFEKKLKDAQKAHGDKGFLGFGAKPRKMTRKQKRIVDKAMKKPKRKKGWFW